jgi:methyltransferase (TIGR00027 family)
MTADGARSVRAVPPARRSRTAQGVVAERALLTHLGVIDDPYAESMLEPGFRYLNAVLCRLPSRTWCRSITLAGLGARVAWMDAHITAAMDGGIDQVAIIGAGFDSRAWRMGREGVRWYELDQPASQMAKRQVSPGPGPVFVEADLRSQAAAPVLQAAGLDQDRPAVLVLEGVTMYLSEETVRDQLEDLVAWSAPGSRLLADFTPPPDSGSAGNRRQLWLQRAARGGSGERFRLTVTPGEAASLVESAGWAVTEVVPLRDAARMLVPAGSGLPVDRINPGKALVAARANSGDARSRILEWSGWDSNPRPSPCKGDALAN